MFLKLLKWTISMFLTITGIYFLILVDMTGDIRPIMLSLICFGIVYWLYKSRDDFPKAVAIMSAAVLAISFACMTYLPMAYQFIGGEFYAQWLGWAGAIGLPAAIITFWKFD